MLTGVTPLQKLQRQFTSVRRWHRLKWKQMKPRAFLPQNFSEKAPTRNGEHNQPFPLYTTILTPALHLLEHWPPERLMYLNRRYKEEEEEGEEAPGDEHQSPCCPVQVPAVPPRRSHPLQPPRLSPPSRLLAPAHHCCWRSAPPVGLHHSDTTTRCHASKKLPGWQSKLSLNIGTGGVTPVTACTSEPWIHSRTSNSGVGR